ncbi:cytochrome d ubiquinol oxidase subunit II [Corynebacterium sp.]|uniref:cytochrome d ubiquinol oxidase subunit II n=1 Tax=Corynebacterium sp. TaxID=1720 RepID=UPI0026DC42FB|nr:cytochrome d ubiquinol oxidase subunit II [Corynebacterium sp.]MDO4609852.1 cytochrome d ubiquinol oxidase subunit II [Corynebacterium sp.]
MLNALDLPVIWFILVAVLFAGYFLLEGFDFGVGMLLPFLGRDERRRAAILKTIGPVWDGNEVWLITAGGALFAAFPVWYATMFSGFYLPLFLILLGLIVRAVALEWRGKVDTARWRAWCDRGIVAGSWLPPILWGVAVANLVRGVPVRADATMATGLRELAGLLSPYALLGGAGLTALFLLHGLTFLRLKTAGVVRAEAAGLLPWVTAAAVVLAGSFVIWTQLSHGKPWTWAAASLAVLGVAGGAALVAAGRDGLAFTATAVAVLAVTALAFGSLYPYLMPTSLADGLSLDIRNASSGEYTLTIMTWAAIAVTPVVMLYQGWTYWVFRRRITAEPVPSAPAGA